jgi:hypothetical protein
MLCFAFTSSLPAGYELPHQFVIAAREFIGFSRGDDAALIEHGEFINHRLQPCSVVCHDHQSFFRCLNFESRS